MEVPNWILEQPPGWVSWLVIGLTLLGLFLTALGLWLAWAQLRRTADAAQAAKTAAQDTRERLRRYDTVIACQEAIRLLREIRGALDGQQWQALLDRHEQLSLVLVDIKERETDLVPLRDKLEIRNVLKDLEKAADRIRRRQSDSLDTESLADLASGLQKQLSRLAEISARLHGRQDQST